MKNTQAYGGKSAAVESGKKRMDSMVNPDGEKYEDGDTTKEESEETPQEDSAEAEASTIMDSINDKPEVCHALYAMLEEKYSSGKEEGKGEKAPAGKGGKDEEFTAEGMD